MLLSALSFLIGISFVQQWAALPGSIATYALVVVLLAVLPLWWFYRSRPASRLFQSSGFVLAGILWAIIQGQDYIDHRLPEELAGQNVHVEGVIEGIPVTRDKVQRFVLKVQKFGAGDMPISPEKLRLSWYYGEKVNAGERWHFLVRLKPPHGFLNPGGFDYEGWLYQHRIHATGYIRKSSDNQRLDNSKPFSLDALRQKLSTHIQTVLADKPLAGLVTALAVGDRSPIDKTQWNELIKTGTNHLMAISGLHIGLAAAFGFWLVRRLVPVSVMQRHSAQQLAVSGGLVVALIYALLAGLSIPTQRALLMLFCFAGAWLLKRNFRTLDALATALLAILIWDPVAVLSAGFWFSFLAVFVIFYVFSGRLQANNHWKQWGWMQFSVALGLFPVSLLLFQQTSLAGPLANLVMVPYVSFFVVPLVLLALLVLPLSTTLSDFLLIAANYLLELIWPFLSWLSGSQFSYWAHAVTGMTEVSLALLGVLLLLAPRGIPARWLGLVLILPIVMNSAEAPTAGSYEVTLLDVGQGLATVVRTRNHVLVFDTGDKFSSQLDIGEAVVVPYLRQLSIDHINRLIISHGDSDHIGGAQTIISSMSVAELVGQDIEKLDHPNKAACVKGEQWHWDGVDFEFLHPDERTYKRTNNRSCLLKISGPGGSVLLTGDIEKKVEKILLSKQVDLNVDVLVVPHHGSKSSSSQRFIKAVDPEVVLFPVGYRNRYRLPNKDIVARYEDSGADLYSSGHSGAIKVIFSSEKGVSVTDEYRKNHHKYWNHAIAFHRDESFQIK
jgi:competence protein ComEC